MARARRQAPEPEPGTVVTRADLAKHLAGSFRDGTSLIDTPQKHPPPVGLGVQATVEPGKKNYLPRTPEQEQRGETATECKANRKDVPTMYKRSRFGTPTMQPNQALPTLESLVARSYCNQLSEKGYEVGNGRFATMKQANAVNKAYTGRSKGGRILSPAAQGVGLELKTEQQDMRPLGKQPAKDAKTDKVRRDSNNQPIMETVEAPVVEGEKGLKPKKPDMKVLYNTDDFVFDTMPERVDRVDPSDRDTVYDEKGEKIDVSGGTRGKILYNEEGKPAFKNFDDQGNSIPPRIGDIRRDDTGEAITRSVARTGRSPSELTTVGQAVTAVNQALEDQATRRVDGTNTKVTIVKSDKVEDLDLKLKPRDPADPESINQVTLTVPKEFESPQAELATLSRASAHLEQVIDSANPNHTNACRAAAMTPSKREGSKEFASAELVAQHAAMNNVTRAGETWTPMPAEHNDKSREHWAKQVEDPNGRGLQTFADSVDRCSRVVAGKQPTYDLDMSRANQNRAEGAARTRAERKEAAQELAQERAGQRPALDLGTMAAGGPTRGEGQEAGGAEPADKAKAPGRKKAGSQADDDGDPTGSGER